MPLIAFIAIILITLHPAWSHADLALDKDEKWHLYGDARLRAESDFNGTDTAGNDVDDRTRARVRLRAGLMYQPNDTLTFDTRIRTGSNGAHQSPHITFHDFHNNDNGPADINFDRWYVGYKKQHENRNDWAWAGRNNFPFWSHDEILWDDDATILGAAFGTTFDLDHKSTVGMTLGAFTLPVGLDDFNGYMAGGEVVYTRPVNDVVYSLGGTVLDFMPDRDDTKAGLLLNGNGFRKYTIGALNAAASWNYRDLPVIAEADFLYNFQNYSATDSDPYTAANHDQRKGFVLSAQVGDLGTQGHWMAAYYYARVEALALNSSYAQDEWVRWGGGTMGESRNNNMRGHQFNLGYAFTDNFNVLGKLFIVDAINTSESGNRFRVDFNYAF